MQKRSNDTEAIEGRPSKICRQTFISRPDFWVVAGILLALATGVFAYAITYESRMTKCEQKIEGFERSSMEIVALLKRIDRKLEQ